MENNTAERKITCPKCGAETLSWRSRCDKCGEDLHVNERKGDLYFEPMGCMFWFVIVGVVVLIIVVAVIGTVIYYSING